MTRSVLTMLAALVLGSGCAGQQKPPVPTSQMAEASMAVHRAHQGTCRKDPEGRALYAKAERALDESRKQVRSGDNQKAARLADQALHYAMRAIAEFERPELLAGDDAGAAVGSASSGSERATTLTPALGSSALGISHTGALSP